MAQLTQFLQDFPVATRARQHAGIHCTFSSPPILETAAHVHIYGKKEALGSDEQDLTAGIRTQTHVVVLQQGQYSWPNDMRFNLHGPQTPRMLRCIKKPYCYAT